MFYLNKIIGFLTSPSFLGLAALAFAVLYAARAKRRGLARGLLIAAFAFCWLWLTPLMTWLIGLPLERPWLVDGRIPAAGSFPSADAIVCLGGGMGGNETHPDHAEMWTSADRVWQAARLYKAGKAPLIICTGTGTERTTKGLLVDFGVPTNALVFLDKPRNTEEEGKAIAELLGARGGVAPKVLLVTSAWHMRRAKLMFEKYAAGLEIVAAPADFEAVTLLADGFKFKHFLPSGQALAQNEYCFREWIGYLGYRCFR